MSRENKHKKEASTLELFSRKSQPERFLFLSVSVEQPAYSSNFRITRQGFPTATELAGILFVTTLPAPMTLLSPMLTPGNTQT